ncbi:MAG: hypothetical protein L6455_11990 [Kiritimatiellae bacterium]|nr:hypothetical protein [Kiritimatiellia bacterium]
MRPFGLGEWGYLSPASGSRNVIAFYAGCLPVPGDYDGDGLDDLSVYHAATGYWAIRYSGSGETAIFGPIGPGFITVMKSAIPIQR